MSLHRRALIAALPALAFAPGVLAAVPASGRLGFNVMRKGQKLGEHRLAFQRAGDDLSVVTDVSMLLKLGPVAVLTYSYHAVERWRGDAFVSIETRATTNGKAEQTRARRTDAGVVANGQTLPANALPLVHWNAWAVRAPLFNPQTGKLMKAAASRRADTLTLAGKPTPTTRVTLSGEAPLDDWYDAQGVWLALNARVKDGSIIEYRRA